MYLRRMIVALALTGSVASCSRETTGPADISNDGGLGNKTLFVEATVDVDWDSEAASFVSRFQVIVLDGNDREVREADVTILGGFGSQTLLEDKDAGVYEGQLARAVWGTLELSIEKDGMSVTDVKLSSIGIHDFLEPMTNDEIQKDTPLTVRWLHDMEAPLARLATADFSWEDIPDTGEYVIPPEQNPENRDQRIELVRSNEVSLSGALAGSFFRIEVRNVVEPLVVR